MPDLNTPYHTAGFSDEVILEAYEACLKQCFFHPAMAVAMVTEENMIVGDVEAFTEEFFRRVKRLLAQKNSDQPVSS